MINFPTLRLGILQSLLELRERFNHDSKIFDAADCPYDHDTVVALKSIFRERVVEKVVEKVVQEKAARGRPGKDTKLSSEDELLVENSAKELLEQLKSLGEGEAGLDTQTKIQIIKAKATVLEQILKIRERWFNVKRTAEFQTVVIGVLEDLMSEDSRREFLNRIEPYRE